MQGGWLNTVNANTFPLPNPCFCAQPLGFVGKVRELGRGRVDLTIGSALDIFGGDLPYEDVVRWQRRQEG